MVALVLLEEKEVPGTATATGQWRDVVGEIHGRFGLGEPWELEDGDDNSDGDDKKGMGDDGDNLNH